MVYIAGTKTVVDTGDTYFGEIAKLPIAGRDEAVKLLNIRDRLLTLPVLDAKPIEARIEYARYIVDCPNCNNAEFAFEDKLFLCSLCKNSNVGGKVRKVKMPKERKKIEDELSKRPIKNRHWIPDVTEEDE